MTMRRKMILKLVLSFLLVPTLAQAACTIKYSNNLRQGPSTHTQVLRKLGKYTYLEILSEKEKWLQVKGKNYQGWIHESLIDKNMHCFVVTETENVDCPGKKDRKRDTIYLEGFKTIKKEIGCNLALDRYGNQFWINSNIIWPDSEAKLLQL
jgi:SH3-like domain-containing protein